MTVILLYNSRSRRLERLAPVRPGHVGMYLCGPTVYDRAHLGNARPAVVFDVLFRLLRHTYGADSVTYVRNFTDVDDRINAIARQQHKEGATGSLGELIRRRTDETIAWYLKDTGALGVLQPTHAPRATEYIGEMVAMIAELIARGHAYEAEGHVLFSVGSWPEYGRLARRSHDDMVAGARVEVAPYKRDPLDFVLWKPSDSELPGWGSPWGQGRPGWHIECSAMSRALLGEEFDIHAGGNDLMFPHHENEIAQSRACGHRFARIWLHNGMLLVDGRKMSKSLGNFFTVRDLLDDGIPGEVIRLVLMLTHYRKPMDWTRPRREEAERRLRRWRAQTAGVDAAQGQVAPKVVAALAGDLNTHEAIREIDRLSAQGEVEALAASAGLLGLLEPQLGGWGSASERDSALLDEIARLIRCARTSARQTGDYSRADKIRDAVKSAGVSVRIERECVRLEAAADFDPKRLRELVRPAAPPSTADDASQHEEEA